VGGREEECIEIREDEEGLDLVKDREDSAAISRGVGNEVEKDAIEQENETPQIK
jgi:hypothetical protein